MEMDLELGLVVLGFALVTGIAVYFVSVMGIREKSFEEAIAEQKKRSEDLLGKREKKKVIVKDKSKKQNKKREKEKASGGNAVGEGSGDDALEDHTHSEQPHGRHHVEILDEPEILDDPLPTESRRASVIRRDGIKSILLNKEETSPIFLEKEGSEMANHFEIIHPKDDAELIHLRTNKKQVSANAGGDETPPPSPVVPPLPPRKASPTGPPLPPRKVGKKEESSGSGRDKKDKNGSGDTEPVVAVSVGGNLSGVYENLVVEEHVDAVYLENNKSGRPLSPPESPSGSGRGTAVASRANKKSKVRPGGTDQEELNAGKLESALERVPLSSSEIQSLIDILLNKQHAGDSEWINKGRNDTAGNLKKQLAEREKQLAEEQTSVQTLQQKLKDLRTEYSNEKNKFSTVRRQLEETAGQKMAEVQGLQLRLRQLSDVGLGEKQELQKQLRQLQQRCKDLQDEYEAVKVDYRTFRESDQGLRTKAESLEREIGALKTQYGHQGNQLQAAFQLNEELTNQLRNLKEHVRVLEERKKGDEVLLHAQYGSKLQEKETQFLNEVKKVQELLNDTETEKVSLRQQVVTLQSSSQRSSSESSKTLEEVSKRLEDSQKEEKNTKNLLVDAKAELGSLQSKIHEREAVFKKLEEEKASLTAQVGSLTERLAAAATATDAKVNGDVKDHAAAVADSTAAKKQAELELTRLQGQLTEKDVIVRQLETEVKHLATEMKTSSQDINAQKSKNDELRLKNSKLLESLQATEKNLESRLTECEKLVTVEKSIKDIFHKYFPQVGVEKTKATWADEFAKSIQEELRVLEVHSKSQAASITTTASSNDSNNTSVELAQLEGANKKLKDEVVHYQEVLANTEALLCNLQGSIEKEEQGWLERLRQKEAEMSSLKSAAAATVVSAETANPDLSILQKELVSEREEKSVLSQRCSELENNLQNLKTQANQYVSLQKRVDDLQVELETERRTHQELLTENTKLSSLLSSGQESIDKVKQLEYEIAQLKSQASSGSGSTNGVTNGTSPSSDTPTGVKHSVVGGLPQSPSPQSPASPTSSSGSAAPTNAEATPPVEKKKKKKGASVKK